MNVREDYDLIVVGGGPAGQAACLALQGRLARVAVIDEQSRPGGQILRQPPRAFTVSNWLAGGTYRKLKAQLRAFETLSGVDWLGGRSVLDVRAEGDGWRVLVSDGAQVASLRTRRVLIAAGCYDMTTPLPGWTLPGVMSAGAVQAFVKSQRLTPGRRIALAGSHPLQLLVAEQIIEAGGEVGALAFAQSLQSALVQAARRPMTVLAHAPQLLKVLLGGLRLAASGCRIRFGDRPVEVVGEEQVQALRLASGAQIDCDAVALCFGFLPQSDLVRGMGLNVLQGRFGGWTAVHDPWMRSSRSGVYVAGETTGVKGAEAAGAEGALAGLAIALDEGLITSVEAERRARGPRRRRGRAMRFAELLDAIADPSVFLSQAQPADTILCRCEDVTQGAVDAAVATVETPNAVKLSTRCGMGPCQGRNCEHLLLQRMNSVEKAPRGFRARFPARPVRIGDLTA